MKSYVAYRMTPLLMPLTGIEGQFCGLKLLDLGLTVIPRET